MSWDPVYWLVKQIPRGRVTTYGALAKALRLPGGARAVGYAMAACPNGRGIPWHRVVGAGGHTRMPEPQASLQQKLLSSEGIALKGLTIDMKVYGWLPKRKPRNKPGKSTIKSTRKSNRHNSPKLRA
jgi:methylated-DNA-protein-cysteine methyltransferase-like protein